VSELADDLAEAVLAVPGVSRLNGGPLGEIGTYLPGRRVPGIRFREAEGRLDVHVVLTHDAAIRDVAAAVHRAAEAVVRPAGTTPAVAVTVHVDDLD
jgi:uncharacterized alkaline shock family protein YloU